MNSSNLIFMIFFKKFSFTLKTFFNFSIRWISISCFIFSPNAFLFHLLHALPNSKISLLVFLLTILFISSFLSEGKLGSRYCVSVSTNSLAVFIIDKVLLFIAISCFRGSVSESLYSFFSFRILIFILSIPSPIANPPMPCSVVLGL